MKINKFGLLNTKIDHNFSLNNYNILIMTVEYLYKLELPGDILIKIRKYFDMHPIAIIYNNYINELIYLSRNIDFLDLINHFIRKYEYNEDDPDFCIRWAFIEHDKNFKYWIQIYKKWLLWEGVLYNLIYD